MHPLGPRVNRKSVVCLKSSPSRSCMTSSTHYVNSHVVANFLEDCATEAETEGSCFEVSTADTRLTWPLQSMTARRRRSDDRWKHLQRSNNFGRCCALRHATSQRADVSMTSLVAIQPSIVCMVGAFFILK